MADRPAVKHYDAFMDVGGEDPRVPFMEELIRIGATDDRLVMVDVDVSRRTLTRNYRDRFPGRFWDFGVAEQNMMGVTAGLAAAGRLPFAFAFSIFTSTRAVEQLRTSICYPRLNAKVIGGYAGLSNGKDGATHQSIEDVAIARSIPNLVVVSPSDPAMATAMARAVYEYEGPVYVRMEYENTPSIHGPGLRFEIGHGVRVREGRDVTIATYGIALARAMEAATALAAEGIDAEVLDMASLKPLDTELLLASVRRTGALVTLEDHNVIGGLASAAADVLLRAGTAPRFRALGIPDVFTESGPNDGLRAKFGIDAAAVVRAARDLVSAPEARLQSHAAAAVPAPAVHAAARPAPAAAPTHPPRAATPASPADRAALAAALSRTAYRLRCDVAEMVYNAGSGHLGGSFSAAEIVASLYWHVLRADPADPGWTERDRLVLSKGHCAPIVYAALARRGYFDLEVLRTFRKLGSILQGHPDFRKTPGLDMTSGSLGHGLSVGLGMALASRQSKVPFRVYVLMSDGEMQEGMVWEAAMASAHYGVGNLTVFVDKNRLQVDGFVGDIVGIDPLPEKWTAFGWEVLRTDGHDTAALLDAIEARWAGPPDRPAVIICDTVKGKGVSWMENVMEWHGGSLNDELRALALEELLPRAGTGDD